MVNWTNKLDKELIDEIAQEFTIDFPREYVKFLLNHRKLAGTVVIEVDLGGKLKELIIERIFNVVQLVRSLSYRNSLPGLIENEIIGIGFFLGSELLGLGVGEENFGKIYFSEVDIRDFFEIYPSLENLLDDLQK